MGVDKDMPDEKRHESADLEDYEVLDASDTLDGAPGDDPLDRGVATPERWSAGMRFGTTAAEQEAGESLEQLLAEEEPDVDADPDDARPDLGWDENATDDDIGRFRSNQGSDPRTGRLVAEDRGADPVDEPDLVAHDAGIDGGGASAEEAAVHVVADDDADLGSGER
jgi:hypothetical protein